mmetsp:Transcript_44122/g.66506  ORF Transcript_44122/g.66506 Transcript_44122/m.66506 type:complete len:85 (-) Transcript_44122:922-1176(-)
MSSAPHSIVHASNFVGDDDSQKQTSASGKSNGSSSASKASKVSNISVTPSSFGSYVAHAHNSPKIQVGCVQDRRFILRKSGNFG